jgi:alkylated DNA repair dioxygenase AlkB
MTICEDFQLVEGFCPAEKGWIIYQRLLVEQNWPDNHYQFAGRQFVLPRLQTWHADVGIRYSYSNNLLITRPWTPLLSEIRAEVETFLGFAFNSVLVNCYRNGEDHVGWHADDEPELGKQPLIASLSFGEDRYFALRHKKSAAHDRILLSHGTLLIMQPAFQHHWLHSIPIEQNRTHSRINLTFRKVVR